MRPSLRFFMCGVLLFFLSISVKAQDDSNVLPFRIVFCDAQFVGFAYTIVGETRSIPPHQIKKQSGYIYDITISIVPRDTGYRSEDHFGLVCRLPGGKTEGVILNEDRNLIQGVAPVSFTFRIQAAERGAASFQLGLIDPSTGSVKPVPDILDDAQSTTILN